MKDINNIEDWYRDELSSYNVEPNKNGWDSLSNDLDANSPLTEENVSEWYKKEAAKLEERPDYRVWEKLSTKLDTASVWDKLSVSLTRYEQTIWWRNMAIRGTAIFLLFAGSYATYEHFNTDELIAENKTNNSSNKENQILKTTENSILHSFKTKEKKPQKKANNNNNSPLATANTPTAINTKKITPINNGSFESNYIEIAKINSLSSPNFSNNIEERDIKRNINNSLISEENISSGYEQKEFLVKKKKNKIVFNNKRFSSHFIYGLYARRFYLGLNFGIKKQGMITSLKNDPSLGEFKEQNFLDFGKTLGSTFGWIVSDKLNLETNLNFISTAGYNSAYSNENGSFEEELKLHYTTLSILAKKMNNKSTFDNKKYSTNIIGGVYAGYLNSSTSNINGSSFDNNTYNNIDFGIVLGLEQDRYITKSFVITPGIRYQQGLINIANESSNFQSARNFSFELNLGIKYIFLKKG